MHALWLQLERSDCLIQFPGPREGKGLIQGHTAKKWLNLIRTRPPRAMGRGPSCRTSFSCRTSPTGEWVPLAQVQATIASLAAQIAAAGKVLWGYRGRKVLILESWTTSILHYTHLPLPTPPRHPPPLHIASMDAPHPHAHQAPLSMPHTHPAPPPQFVKLPAADPRQEMDFLPWGCNCTGQVKVPFPFGFWNLKGCGRGVQPISMEKMGTLGPAKGTDNRPGPEAGCLTSQASSEVSTASPHHSQLLPAL